MTPDKIKQRAKEIRESEPTINLVLDKQIKKAWKMLRPKMWARLQKEGTTNDLALIVQVAMWESVEQYEKAGLPPTDAREQAEKEWLMMESEKNEETQAA